MMLVIETQRMENYGDWDNPYWKMKGGSSYKIVNVPGSLSDHAITRLTKAMRLDDDEWSQEYVTGHHYENDDWTSWFEQSQLDYDGEILYPEVTFDYADLVNDVIAESVC